MAIKSVAQFLQEVRIELTKVVWPKWDEFTGSVIIVLVLITLFALYLGFLDLAFSAAARFVFRWYVGF
jgi:preprotein translocase SecE subunit